MRLFPGGSSRPEPASRIDVSAINAEPADIIYVMHLLAFSYQQIGRSDDADTILQALTDAFGMDNYSLHQALSGDTAGVLRALRSTAGRGWAKYYGPGNYYEIINDPAWAETIKAPEFHTLLGAFKQEVDRQRAIVEATDAEHDFRAEIEALLSNLCMPIESHTDGLLAELLRRRGSRKSYFDRFGES